MKGLKPQGGRERRGTFLGIEGNEWRAEKVEAFDITNQAHQGPVLEKGTRRSGVVAAFS
jgi:hypothetical protein